jgi:hypothetical protein
MRRSIAIAVFKSHQIFNYTSIKKDETSICNPGAAYPPADLNDHLLPYRPDELPLLDLGIDRSAGQPGLRPFFFTETQRERSKTSGE